MILRIVLAGLLAVAFNASAIAQCRIGLSFQTAHADVVLNEHDAATHAGEKEDCGKSEPRACDAMVQAMAPPAPDVAPAVSDATPAVAFLTNPSFGREAQGADKANLPFPRSQRFRDVHARNGRLLV